MIDDGTVGSPGPLLKLFMLCFPPQMQIYLYNADDFDSLGAAIKERRIIAAIAVFFEVSVSCFFFFFSRLHSLDLQTW